MGAELTISAARRISLGSQGFAGKPTAKAITSSHFASVMTRLGLIQLDSVNVCARSHYMPFYSRLGAYKQDALDTWLNTKHRHFEYWAHEACVMPVDKYPLWRWKMREWVPRRVVRTLMSEHPGLVKEVLKQVKDYGPITIRELEAPKARNRPWWGHGPGKIALEFLFAQGELTALRTDNFRRLYDLPERSIPKSHRLDERYDKHLAHRQLLLDSVRHFGIGTTKDLADYFRLKAGAAAPILAQLASEGHIEEVVVKGWKGPAYRDPAAKCPRAIRGSSLLSPFDPVIWYRDRGERLFQFHYRIEIYTPKEKRKHGYYVLPFMLDGELVGRVDVKADRKAGALVVPSAFVEAQQDKERVAKALAKEFERFAGWMGLGSIVLGRKGDLMRALRSAL
ncbi:MAG: winged helix-turn-helix domain-containing protein [Myxococcales bacterium]|nr:winged helix-turn-helix domain-containing protein [Myxococcales bacterium]